MQEINIKPNVLIGTWAWGSGYNGASMVFGKKVDEEMLKLSSEDISKIEEEAMKTGIRQQGTWEPQ